MTEWDDFPAVSIDTTTTLFRIHHRDRTPGWFNSDGTGRFDPPPGSRQLYGVSYLGITALASYIEVFGRFKAVPQSEIDRRRLSELGVTRRMDLANLTDRSVLGDFQITAAYSTGSGYRHSQLLSSHLLAAGFDGVLYRVSHDPRMELEAVALFGEPGEAPDRFSRIKTERIPPTLVEAGRSMFHIEVVPAAPLP